MEVKLRVPIATYRIQFNQNCRFADARDLVPYLHDLGISDLYASPRFKARRGSSHGYDVANPLRINSELGAEEDFDELCEKLRSYGMGLLLDIVPNHMAASSENPWWLDVLENGPSSPYAHYFDIDWRPRTSKAAFLQENRVLLPILGDLYGNVLENQELTLKLDESGFYVRYYEMKLPVDPGSYGVVLDRCEELLRQGGAGIDELKALKEMATNLPGRNDAAAAMAERRQVQGAEIKQRLWTLYLSDPAIRGAVEETLRVFDGVRNDPRSFDLMDRLLSCQAYRIAYWKIGYEEINYRRFFDINELVGLQVGLPDVFEARHSQIIQLIREGKVTGLRVDHIDGIRNPLDYLKRLQSACGEQHGVYVVVEKILGRGESLPEDWPVCGTTGYDFLNAVNGIFIDPAGLRAMDAIYARWTGSDVAFSEVCYAKNRQVMRELFGGEVQALGHHLGKLAAQDRHARDLPLSELMQVLVEVTACLPVYRTYITGFDVTERDRGYIERTLELARRRVPESEVSPAAFDFMRRVLLLDPPYYAEDQKEEWLRFLMRWQQFAGPVMAKGLEDTAFYVYHSLLSLNEVGGDPLRERPPFDVEEFHRFNHQRLESWPYSMNTTATHDTKRGEDTRPRLNVLSEIPENWERALRRWHGWNKEQRKLVSGTITPTPNEEFLIYQSLLGAWPYEETGPEFLDRMKGFLVKATREAKTHSSWITPNEAHEKALLEFLEAILSGPGPFLRDFQTFHRKIAFHGALNSLSQLLIKATAPGVPDFYQGTGLWSLSLVDPDNRRPVDYRSRVFIVEEIKRKGAEDPQRLLKELLTNWQDGRVKLFLMHKALELRKTLGELFLDGSYIPIAARGAKREHVCAFVRNYRGAWVLTAAPRLTVSLVKAGSMPLGARTWAETELVLPGNSPKSWRNVLTGEELAVSASGSAEPVLPLAAVLRRFPVALLYAE